MANAGFVQRSSGPLFERSLPSPIRRCLLLPVALLPVARKEPGGQTISSSRSQMPRTDARPGREISAKQQRADRPRRDPAGAN